MQDTAAQRPLSWQVPSPGVVGEPGCAGGFVILTETETTSTPRPPSSSKRYQAVATPPPALFFGWRPKSRARYANTGGGLAPMARATPCALLCASLPHPPVVAPPSAYRLRGRAVSAKAGFFCRRAPQLRAAFPWSCTSGRVVTAVPRPPLFGYALPYCRTVNMFCGGLLRPVGRTPTCAVPNRRGAPAPLLGARGAPAPPRAPRSLRSRPRTGPGASGERLSPRAGGVRPFRGLTLRARGSHFLSADARASLVGVGARSRPNRRKSKKSKEHRTFDFLAVGFDVLRIFLIYESTNLSWVLITWLFLFFPPFRPPFGGIPLP